MESVVEDATFAWLDALGYVELHAPDIMVGEPGAERSEPLTSRVYYNETILSLDL